VVSNLIISRVARRNADLCGHGFVFFPGRQSVRQERAPENEAGSSQKGKLALIITIERPGFPEGVFRKLRDVSLLTLSGYKGGNNEFPIGAVQQQEN
jgi:hypothetical protein